MQDKSKHLFLSYSTKNEAVADKLVADLEEKGVQCWIAPRDIKPGETWAASIMNAIASSSVMILLLSEESNESVQVIREVEHAVNQRIPVIPIRLSNLEPSDAMKYFISTHQWLDAYKSKYKLWSSRLFNRLTEIESSSNMFVAESRVGISEDVIHQAPSKNPSILISRKLLLSIVAMLGLIATVYVIRPGNEAIDSDSTSFESGDIDSVQAFSLQAQQLEEIAEDQHLYPEIAASALLDAGEAYINANELEDAIRVFTDLSEQYPEQPHACIGLFRIADVLVDKQRFIDAGNLYITGFDVAGGDDDSISFLISAADAYERGGANSLAVATIMRLFENPDNSASKDDVLTLEKLSAYEWCFDYLTDHADYSSAREIHLNITWKLVSESSPDSQISLAYQNLLLNFADMYVDRYNGDSLFLAREVYLIADVYYSTGELTKAGDLYMSIYDSGEYTNATLVNAFSSYGQAYESEHNSVDSSLMRQRMSEIAYMYSEEFPEGEYVCQFLFAVAGFSYNVQSYETARETYLKIIYDYPESAYCARAARFTASAYEAEENFSKASHWYLIADSIALYSGEQFPQDLELLAVTSEYRYAESRDTSLRAALLFEELALRHPASEIAPVSLFDAAETYVCLSDAENAHRIFQMLVVEYANTGHAYQASLRRGRLYIDSGQYQLAADMYLQACESYPGEEYLSDVIYSAAFAYEMSGNLEIATELYLDIIRESSDNQITKLALMKVAELALESGSYMDASNFFADAICLDFTLFRAFSLTFKSSLRLGVKSGQWQESLRLLDVFKEALLNSYFSIK